MGANVTVVDRSAEALRRIAAQFGCQVRTIFSTRDAIRQIVKRADLLTPSRDIEARHAGGRSRGRGGSRHWRWKSVSGAMCVTAHLQLGRLAKRDG